MESTEIKLMPIEEYLKEKDLLDQAEKRIFEKQGLGWLLKFMSDVQQTKNEQDGRNKV